MHKESMKNLAQHFIDALSKMLLAIEQLNIQQ